MSIDLKDPSLLGIARGICVHTLIFPLEVLKIRQQCSSNSENCLRVAKEILKKDGVRGFYEGLPPQLVKTCIKQAWVWRVIVYLPEHFKKYGFEESSRLALTGLTIALIDAGITTPLEKAKIRSAFTGKRQFSFSWQGFGAHFAKLTVAWTTFLVIQKSLRKQHKQNGQLPLGKLVTSGLKLAAIMSIALAPFDIANTLKQAQNRSIAHFLSQNGLRKLYLGWPINLVALSIHNIASMVLIDQFTE